MPVKRRRHPCNKLKDEHVEWVISKHAKWKWWRSLQRDVTKDLLRDVLKTSAFFLLRWVLPLVVGGAGLKLIEKWLP